MRICSASCLGKLIIAGAYVSLALAVVTSMGCTPKTDPSFEQGKEIYQTDCVACHGRDGGGVLYSEAVLNKSAFVTGNPEKVIAVILHGKVGGGVMPSWQENLQDQEVAAVATYIRQAWSNHADAVTGAMVNKIRTSEKKNFSTNPK
jgi:mono/diheme cytochrome c family protein